MLLSFMRRWLTPDILSTLLPMLVVGGVGGLISWQYQSGLRHERDLVAHTWDVISTTGDLLTSIADAETGQRGYVITGNPTFLAPYAEAPSKIADSLTRTRGLVADNPDQQSRLDRLRPLVTRKLTEMEDAIALRRTRGFEAAQTFVAGSEGKAIMDEARGIVAEITQAERLLLEQRTARVRTRERWVALVGISAALLSIATRGLVSVWLRRRLKKAQHTPA